MELKLYLKNTGRKVITFFIPFVMILLCAGSIIAQPAPAQQNAHGNLDIEFQPDYKTLIPGYREKTVDMVEGSSEDDSENPLQDISESDISFFTKIFSDRTLINILLVGLGFLILIIYRLRSGKIRR